MLIKAIACGLLIHACLRLMPLTGVLYASHSSTRYGTAGLALTMIGGRQKADRPSLPPPTFTLVAGGVKIFDGHKGKLGVIGPNLTKSIGASLYTWNLVTVIDEVTRSEVQVASISIVFLRDIFYVDQAYDVLGAPMPVTIHFKEKCPSDCTASEGFSIDVPDTKLRINPDGFSIFLPNPGLDPIRIFISASQIKAQLAAKARVLGQLGGATEKSN